MSPITRAKFEPLFDLNFVGCKKTDFEDWFANLAECAFGDDFELIKAGGKHGDKKSDGRRISTETIYQCYAPESPATFAANASAKIQDSFPEVVDYWPNLREWVFVHNNEDGIPTSASDVIEGLREEYPEIKIRQRSRGLLKELHDSTSLSQLLDIYPKASVDIEGVRMEHIRPLIKRIIAESGDHLNSDAFGEIPDEEKIDHNGLGHATKFEIRRALPHVSIVDRYLDQQSNPANATRVQASLRNQYLDLKSLGYEPDELFGALVDFVKDTSSPMANAAATIIVSYFFESCDVFENPSLPKC